MQPKDESDQSDIVAENTAEDKAAEEDFIRIRANASVPTLSILMKDQLGKIATV